MTAVLPPPQAGEEPPALRRRALIIDDDEEMREFLAAVIIRAGFEALPLPGPASLTAATAEFGPDLIILDLSLGDTDGIDVLHRLADLRSRAAVLVVSGLDERLLRSAVTLGESFGLTMLGTLRKPVKPAALREILTRAPLRHDTLHERDLTAAIAADQLFLNFQPKVDMQSRKVLSAEALVRWNDPVRGIIFPDQFISLAERSGLIAPMTDRVLDLALAEARNWADKGWNLAVAVNLSASSLNDLEFPQRVMQRLRHYGVDAGRLILEVTETTAMTDPQVTMDILTRLRIKGVAVSLDDFGTGYSSLVELHRMPFSELKIDRSFVMKAPEDKDARIIVQAILDLSHALSMQVVAEGVETQAHWSLLAAAGCDMAQGYFLSRPLPAAEFIAWTEQWTRRPWV